MLENNIPLESVKEFYSDDDYSKLHNAMYLVKRFENINKCKRIGLSVSADDYSMRDVSEMFYLSDIIEEARKKKNRIEDGTR